MSEVNIYELTWRNRTMTTKYTDLELEVLNILADEHGEEWISETDEADSQAHNDTWLITVDGLKQGDDVTIFQYNNLDPKIYRGVIGSLVRKDAVFLYPFDTRNDRGDQVEMVLIGLEQHAFNEIRGI